MRPARLRPPLRRRAPRRRARTPTAGSQRPPRGSSASACRRGRPRCARLRALGRGCAGAQQLAIALLFGLGLLLGLAVAPVVAEYAKADPAALWQAAGATAAFVAGCGAYGYATRRDLSAWTRALFWALLALIGFGLVAIFVSIPGANVIYPVAGLVIFGGFTIVEFNRLRRSSDDTTGGAVAIAAGIFLDIFNVFLLFFDLFGGGGSDN
jgi:FtsH-binding integral membrane protein